MWGNAELVSLPIVVSVPELSPKPDQCSRKHPEVFSACAVTRAMVRHGDPSADVSLEDTFFVKPESVPCNFSKPPVGENPICGSDRDDPLEGDGSSEMTAESNVVPPVEEGNDGKFPPTEVASNDIDGSLSDLFKVSREELIREQTTDSTLQPLFALATAEYKVSDAGSGYCMQNGLLCRQWVFQCDTYTNTVLQVVVPCKFRKAVLELAHNGVAGHTGVGKT